MCSIETPRYRASRRYSPISSRGSTTAATPASSSPIRYDAHPRSSWAICRKSTHGNLPCEPSHCTRNYSLILVTVTEIFDTNPTVCAVCGERPGTVRMVFAAGPQRRAAMLCETCATEVRERQTPAKKSPLDEFGHDLTAAAAAGR